MKKRLKSQRHKKEKTGHVLWEAWTLIWNLTKQIMEWSSSSVQRCITLPWTIFVMTSELLKVLRWSFNSFNIFSLVFIIRSEPHTTNVYACVSASYWNVFRLCRPIWHSKTTSLVLRLETCFKTWLFKSPLQKKLISYVIFYFCYHHHNS